jgi:tRNA(adenine34) deaminase
MNANLIERYMKIVTKIASKITNEVPIVCLMIKGNLRKITQNIGLEHAEMIMINSYDVRDSYIFVNIEPCPMCTFALSLRKVRRIFFGSFNECYGACGGAFLLSRHVCCKIVEADGGFFQNENKVILQKFFQKRR